MNRNPFSMRTGYIKSVRRRSSARFALSNAAHHLERLKHDLGHIPPYHALQLSAHQLPGFYQESREPARYDRGSGKRFPLPMDLGGRSIYKQLSQPRPHRRNARPPKARPRKVSSNRFPGAQRLYLVYSSAGSAHKPASVPSVISETSPTSDSSPKIHPRH